MPPIAARRVFDHAPTDLPLFCLRVPPGIERADGLRRILEGGVVPVHPHLREHGHYGRKQPDLPQFILDRKLEEIADFALCGGDTDVQRLRVDLAGRSFRPQQRGADLGTVAVCDYQLPAPRNQLHNALCRRVRVGKLLVDRPALARADERIAADGHECDLRHGVTSTHQL